MTLHAALDVPERYKLRTVDYETLAAAGAFGTQRTELIDGEIVLMSPQYRPHGLVKMALYDALRQALIDAASPLSVMVECSLALSPTSMPDPDLLLTSEPRGSGPVPLASVSLVVEVSDTTLTFDLVDKAAAYAVAGIAEYWVADVNARRVHQFWSPIDRDYTEQRNFSFGDRIDSATIAKLGIDTDRL